MKSKNIKETVEVILDYSGRARPALKKAFYRRTTAVAEFFTLLGKPMRARTARKMTEESLDVKRRTILENACLLLGASFLASPKSFEILWQHLASFACALRGDASAGSFDHAFSEFRYAYAFVERAYFRGELKDAPEPLIYVDHSLRVLWAHSQVII